MLSILLYTAAVGIGIFLILYIRQIVKAKLAYRQWKKNYRKFQNPNR